MKLWEVTNGYTGESYVRVVVIASDECSALAQAMRAYEADKRYRGKDMSLVATCVSEDTSREWCSLPSDSGIEVPVARPVFFLRIGAEANDG